MEYLYSKLCEYAKENNYPMHMPGHKRNEKFNTIRNPFEIDITEIDGFDNLHDAEDILKNCMIKAADLYKSDETSFLINGSTAGILAAIMGCTQRGDKIIIARNCHKSVYNAVKLNDLIPMYIYPQIDKNTGISYGILAEDVENLLYKNKDVKAVVICSPTYEGIVSDIKSIGIVIHKFNIPLIVDEAHGAHFGFSNRFPQNSILNGGDIVIHSLHKTLPALTQTALIHFNGYIVDRYRVKEYLTVFQTSSPSYVLMSSIDQCISILNYNASKLFDDFSVILDELYEKVKNLKNLVVYKPEKSKELHIYDFDFSKIIISTHNSSINGVDLYKVLLNNYNIQMEMVSDQYVLGITSICDTKEGIERFLKAIFEIDSNIESCSCENDEKCLKYKNIILDVELSPLEAYNKQGEWVRVSDSVGRVAKSYIYMFPPGIPFVVPGEIISEELVERLIQYENNNLIVKGIKKKDGIYIHVVI